MNQDFCITLIGMPGAGKSTIGKHLANMAGFAFIDSDYLLESLYGRKLQEITDMMDRKTFLDAEAAMILAIQAKRCVIATGGSVIYRPEAMRHLQKLGPIVYLELPFNEIKRRVELCPDRGISFGPGQSLEHLHNERKDLYAKYADFTVDTSKQNARECAQNIMRNLPKWINRNNKLAQKAN